MRNVLKWIPLKSLIVLSVNMNVKKGIKIFGVGTMFAFSVLLFITFMAAYVSPAKSARVFVNFFGEADFELMLMSVLLVIQTAAFIILMKEFKAKKA